MDAEGLLSTLLRWLYQKISPKQLGDNKPRFVWFPRYRFEIRLAEELVALQDPGDALEERLAEQGFALEYWTREQIVFSRGKFWGDFSIKLVPLRLRVDIPLQSSSMWTIEAAGVALFDTGDVWSLAHEIKSLFEQRP